MSNPLLEILIIFLLLVANGVFAMAEISIVSARKARLQQLANMGNAQARTALTLAAEPNQFLATTQIGITLVGILAGAFGGATLAENIAAQASLLPLLAPYSEAIGVGVVVLGLTYFSLIIGELVPKRLGLDNAERIAMAMAGPMQLLSALTAPVVKFLSLSTDLLIRLLGVKPSTEPTITPEEIKVLVEQGTESGVFAEAEQDMIEGVLRLDERRVGALMTPRPQMVCFDIADAPAVIQEKIATSQHSRFPVIQDSPDNVLGIVRAKDLLTQTLAGQPLNLRAFLRPPLFIPESMSALKVLELFKQGGTHIALVMDEFGGLQGLVTHSDILEAIVGNIPPASGAAAPQATQRADGSWLIDGLLSIHELQELLALGALPEGHYQTVGGFVMTQLDSIPEEGQSFEWGQLRFEVVDMDGRRVDKVLVVPKPAAEA